MFAMLQRPWLPALLLCLMQLGANLAWQSAADFPEGNESIGLLLAQETFRRDLLGLGPAAYLAPAGGERLLRVMEIHSGRNTNRPWGVYLLGTAGQALFGHTPQAAVVTVATVFGFLLLLGTGLVARRVAGPPARWRTRWVGGGRG